MAAVSLRHFRFTSFKFQAPWFLLDWMYKCSRHASCCWRHVLIRAMKQKTHVDEMFTSCSGCYRKVWVRHGGQEIEACLFRGKLNCAVVNCMCNCVMVLITAWLWRTWQKVGMARVEEVDYWCREWVKLLTRYAIYIQDRQCTCNVTLRRICESLLSWKSNKHCIFMCLCVRVPERVGGCMRVRACSLTYPVCMYLIQHHHWLSRKENLVGNEWIKLLIMRYWLQWA